MMTFSLTFFLLIALALLPICNVESGYRGIMVFQSNRGEVERLLGEATTADMIRGTFEDESFKVQVIFSGPRCSNKEVLSGMFDVPEGSVLEYSVTPKSTLPIGELELTMSKYNRIPVKETPRIIEYFNVEKGILIVTNLSNVDNSETVRTIYYQRQSSLTEKYKCQ